MAGAEKRNITKSKIVNYIINHEATSKVELSKDLNLSMPTVLSNVNELLANGIAVETGEYESTGGRKAKRISINPAYRYAVGIRITAKHAGFVLVNLSYEIEKYERIRLEFSTEAAYYLQLSEALERFLSDVEHRERILGIGISIPGIVNSKERMLIKSHALQLENYSLSFLEQIFSLPVYFENDANAAMMAEDLNNYRNALYLSLNNTLGGAFCIDGKLIPGANQKAGEFGHMILVPQGRKCYCGKSGCADAYCAAGALVGESKDSVEQFMQLLQNNDEKAEKKESYTLYSHRFTPEDLVQYAGIRQEIAGRIHQIVQLYPLTKEDYSAILQDEEISPVRRLESQYGIRLRLGKNVREFLIENAMRTRLGVRYLSSQIQQMLDEQMFEDYSKTEYELHV